MIHLSKLFIFFPFSSTISGGFIITSFTFKKVINFYYYYFNFNISATFTQSIYLTYICILTFFFLLNLILTLILPLLLLYIIIFIYLLEKLEKKKLVNKLSFCIKKKENIIIGDLFPSFPFFALFIWLFFFY